MGILVDFLEERHRVAAGLVVVHVERNVAHHQRGGAAVRHQLGRGVHVKGAREQRPDLRRVLAAQPGVAAANDNETTEWIGGGGWSRSMSATQVIQAKPVVTRTEKYTEHALHTRTHTHTHTHTHTTRARARVRRRTVRVS